MITEEDLKHLIFIYARMLNTHKEDIDCDYMLKFKEVLFKLDVALNKQNNCILNKLIDKYRKI